MGAKKEKIWINDIEKYIQKVEHEHQDYLVWVKRIQGNLYRIMKEADGKTRKYKLYRFGLLKNYELFYNRDKEKHIQGMMFIFEKIHHVAKHEEFDEEIVDLCKIFFGMCFKIATLENFELQRSMENGERRI